MSPLKSPKKKEKGTEKKGYNKHLPKKSKTIVPAKKSTDIEKVWTSAHTKFQYGKPLMTADDLIRAGQVYIDLYNYNMQTCRDTKAPSIVIQYKLRHFLTNDVYSLLGFNDLYDLVNLYAMNVSLLIFTL